MTQRDKDSMMIALFNFMLGELAQAGARPVDAEIARRLGISSQRVSDLRRGARSSSLDVVAEFAARWEATRPEGARAWDFWGEGKKLTLSG